MIREIARVATRAALENYERIPEEHRKQLALGVLFDGDYRIFELYIPTEGPQDAIVYTCTWVHVKTGEVLRVEIFNLRRRDAEGT